MHKVLKVCLITKCRRFFVNMKFEVLYGYDWYNFQKLHYRLILSVYFTPLHLPQYLEKGQISLKKVKNILSDDFVWFGVSGFHEWVRILESRGEKEKISQNQGRRQKKNTYFLRTCPYIFL